MQQLFISGFCKGQTMKTLDCNEIQNLMRKAKTLEQFHALGLLYVQTLKEKYKGETYTCYKPKGQSWNKGF